MRHDQRFAIKQWRALQRAFSKRSNKIGNLTINFQFLRSDLIAHAWGLLNRGNHMISLACCTDLCQYLYLTALMR